MWSQIESVNLWNHFNQVVVLSEWDDAQNQGNSQSLNMLHLDNKQKNRNNDLGDINSGISVITQGDVEESDRNSYHSNLEDNNNDKVCDFFPKTSRKVTHQVIALVYQIC